MSGWSEQQFEKLYNEIVPGYQWVNNGTVLVTLSWGLGRRRTVSVPANQFSEATVRTLKAETAREILEGRIA